MADQPTRPTSAPRRRRCSTRPARGKGRGRLKIFLGAAPGVGKTYAMLKAGAAPAAGGRRRRRRHRRDPRPRGDRGAARRASRSCRAAGRRTTAACWTRWTSTPSSRASRSWCWSTSSRTPTRPGSRHPKRYQDVEELLAAGIDVYTTLNIQHIESLNDVVAQITGVRVRETVPDRVLDHADEVELVDLTPDDLIQRLNEGKVYVREQAERALAHYFSPGNLTALRELALRRTAQRVDEQMLEYMRAHAIAGPVGGGRAHAGLRQRAPGRPALVRYAAPGRPAAGALDRDPCRDRRARSAGEAERDRVAEALRLAERLGGEAVTLPGGARHRRGRIWTTRAPTTSPRSSSASPRARAGSSCSTARWSHELVRRAGDISVHVLAGGAGERARGRRRRRAAAAARSTRALCRRADRGRRRDRRRPGCSTAGRPRPTSPGLHAAGASASPCATACGRRWSPALPASLAYNFFFLEPLYTFTIADPANVVALCFFLLVAVVASKLAARARAQAESARQDAPRIDRGALRLQPQARRRRHLDDLLWATAFQVALMLKVHVVMLLPEDGEIAVRAGYPPETSSTTPTSPPPNGPGSTTARPGAAPTPCRAPSGCSCRCAPGAARSASSASTATSRARC